MAAEAAIYDNMQQYRVGEHEHRHLYDRCPDAANQVTAIFTLSTLIHGARWTATMKHSITFKFEGLMADTDEELGGSDYATYIVAARRFLSLHAHCYSSGKVPTAALSQTSEYEVRKGVTRPGCVSDSWSVIIDPWAIAAVGLFAPEIRSGAYNFARFLRDSVRSIVGVPTPDLPQFPQRHRILESLSGNHEPLIDLDHEDDIARTRLRDVGSRVLVEVARPVGRTAERMRIIVDDEEIVVMTTAHVRRLMELEITKFVESVRGQRPEFHSF